jgi:hypothetical protein
MKKIKDIHRTSSKQVRNIKAKLSPPCSFAHGARCTNAGAFVLLPCAPFGATGSEASELGFFSTLKKQQ